MEGETFLADVKISRRSTVTELAETLRDRIYAGEIAPGTALRESSIAQAIGVSRNTVREAFFALVAEGLIRHIAHRGFFVVKLSSQDVADLYTARRVLELAAIDALPPDGPLEGVDSALERLRGAAAANDTADAYEADLEIHKAIVATLGSPRLDAIFTGLLVELRLAIILMDTLSDFPELVAEHERLIQTIRAGDKAAASALLEKHLYDAERLLVAAVDARNSGVAAGRGSQSD